MILPLMIAALLSSTADSAMENQLEETDRGVRVSLVRLIAVPDRYDGKVVMVSGYAFIEFENDNLCIVAKPNTTRDCIWIQYFDGPVETDADLERLEAAKRKWSKFNGKYISIRGIFDASDTGHLGGSSGGIGHITEVEARGR